jgi:protein-tyrosine phosphatase
VTTILDLRSEGETVRNPSPFADGTLARYAHRALIDDRNMNNIGDSKSMLERYLFIVDTRPDAFRDAFEVIAEAEGTLLFHCFAGKDRTGLVAAMLLSMAGVSRDDIAADYAETDIQLARQYEVWIGEAPLEKRDAFREELRCPADRILGVLDHLERKWGGVAGYLEASGMAPEPIDRLTSKLC